MVNWYIEQLDRYQLQTCKTIHMQMHLPQLKPGWIGKLSCKKKNTQPDRPHEATIDSTLKDIQCHGEKL